ncbi:hypothetical protein [Streptomyces sp. NPDC055085]
MGTGDLGDGEEQGSAHHGVLIGGGLVGQGGPDDVDGVRGRRQDIRGIDADGGVAVFEAREGLGYSQQRPTHHPASGEAKGSGQVLAM